MSTDPYPEAGGGETGSGPQQSGRTVEWPKKIRTLTAVELDRLTIDSAGRFYWDGKLVNYEPPQSHESEPKTAEETEQSAMEMIDRTIYELDVHKTPEPTEVTNVPHMVAPAANQNIAPAVEFDAPRPDAAKSPAVAAPVAASIAQATLTRDRVRLSLSFWQSLGALIVVLGIAIGASGVAAYGWVVAHDWTCRIGLVKRYCPPAPPPPRQPARPDIPA